MTKDCNYQLKITVSGDEKRRIEQLAKLRFLTVPQYIKLTALGVKIQQIKEIYVEQEQITYPLQEERLFCSDNVITLQPEEKEVLEELLRRDTRGDGSYIQIGGEYQGKEFNKELINLAKRLLGKETSTKAPETN